MIDPCQVDESPLQLVVLIGQSKEEDAVERSRAHPLCNFATQTIRYDLNDLKTLDAELEKLTAKAKKLDGHHYSCSKLKNDLEKAAAGGSRHHALQEFNAYRTLFNA